MSARYELTGLYAGIPVLIGASDTGIVMTPRFGLPLALLAAAECAFAFGVWLGFVHGADVPVVVTGLA